MLHKLYSKVNNVYNPTAHTEQTASILKAGKAEDLHVAGSQKLISSLNRGGLWVISKQAQTIFKRIEHNFRILTSGSLQLKIDNAKIESKSACDVQLVSAYNTMLLDSDITALQKMFWTALFIYMLLYGVFHWPKMLYRNTKFNVNK